MSALGSALEGVLAYAVAGLESEDAGATAEALNSYNSAWCSLSYAVEVHGGPEGGALPGLVRETVSALLETYRARYEAIRSRIQADGGGPAAAAAASSCRGVGGAGRVSGIGGSADAGGRGHGDVGRRPQLTPGSLSSSSGLPPEAGASDETAQPHGAMSGIAAKGHMDTPPGSAQADDGTSRRPAPGWPAAAPAPQPHTQPSTPASAAVAAAGGSFGPAVPRHAPSPAAAAVPAGEMTEAMAEVLQQCQRHVPPGGSLDELSGLGSVKEEVRMALLLPMRMPHLFTGIRQPPRNFLLHGPPGTGKTMLVERIASEAAAALLVLTPGSILSKWAGESEKQLRAVFQVARALQPCIVFMDEVDSLAPTRGSGDDPVARRLLNELLVQMSCLAEEGAGGRQACVYVFAATNRIQDCDPALLRRFDRRVVVPLPDVDARGAYLAGVLARPEVAGHALVQEDVRQLAELTDGYSGSDLAQLCREAAMQPLRELLRDMAAGGSSGAAATLRWRRADRGFAVGSGRAAGTSVNCTTYGVAACGAARGAGLDGAVDAPAFEDVEVRPLAMCDFERALATVRPVTAAG